MKLLGWICKENPLSAAHIIREHSPRRSELLSIASVTVNINEASSAGLVAVKTQLLGLAVALTSTLHEHKSSVSYQGCIKSIPPQFCHPNIAIFAPLSLSIAKWGQQLLVTRS